MKKHLTSNPFLHPPLHLSLLFCAFSNPSATKMKNKAATFLKRILSVVVTMVKAKSMALKSKSSALKTRFLIFKLLQNKKVLMRAINHKIHALIGQEKGEAGANSREDYSKAIVPYNGAENESLQNLTLVAEVECVEDDYPDLTHTLFGLDDEDEDDGLGNTTGSVIDLVRNSKEDGAEFSLEDEIDHVADVYIKRFHRQMRMQKLESFKRYQEMLERSV